MEYSCDCRNVVVVPKDASASKGKGKENAGTVSVERVETSFSSLTREDTSGLVRCLICNKNVYRKEDASKAEVLVSPSLPGKLSPILRLSLPERPTPSTPLPTPPPPNQPPSFLASSSLLPPLPEPFYLPHPFSPFDPAFHSLTRAAEDHLASVRQDILSEIDELLADKRRVWAEREAEARKEVEEAWRCVEEGRAVREESEAEERERDGTKADAEARRGRLSGVPDAAPRSFGSQVRTQGFPASLSTNTSTSPVLPTAKAPASTSRSPPPLSPRNTAQATGPSLLSASLASRSFLSPTNIASSSTPGFPPSSNNHTSANSFLLPAAPVGPSTSSARGGGVSISHSRSSSSDRANLDLASSMIAQTWEEPKGLIFGGSVIRSGVAGGSKKDVSSSSAAPAAASASASTSTARRPSGSGLEAVKEGVVTGGGEEKRNDAVEAAERTAAYRRVDTPPRSPGEVVEDSGGLRERLEEERRAKEEAAAAAIADTVEEPAALEGDSGKGQDKGKGKEVETISEEVKKIEEGEGGKPKKRSPKRRVTFNEEPDVVMGGAEGEDETTSETPTLTTEEGNVKPAAAAVSSDVDGEEEDEDDDVPSSSQAEADEPEDVFDFEPHDTVLSKSDPPLNPAGMLSPVREKGSKIAGIDRPLDGEDDNKVLVSMKRLTAADLPSHRSGWKDVGRKWQIFGRNTSGSASKKATEEQEDEPVPISRYGQSLPIAIIAPPHASPAPSTSPLEPKTSLTDRQMLVPSLKKARRPANDRKTSSTSSASVASTSVLGGTVASTPAIVVGDGQQGKRDPGPVLDQGAGEQEEEEGEAAGENGRGVGFVPPHLRAVDEPSLGWASYVR